MLLSPTPTKQARLEQKLVTKAETETVCNRIYFGGNVTYFLGASQGMESSKSNVTSSVTNYFKQ